MKPLALVVAVITTMSGVTAPLFAEDAALVRARALLDRVGLVDGHNDLPWTLRETFESDLSRVDLRKRGATVDTDIPRLREGRVSGQFWSVFIPSGLPNPARTQLEQIELARRMIDAYPDTFLLATSAADVERARQQGKIASFLGMENGQALENSLGALRAFYALGVRYMTLTHGKNNDWADSATDTAAHGGLTAFGREVVREMNRLGMLVDISHVSPDVMRQVLDLSEAPVLFSHSSARALVDHRRNVPDDVLARMARNGGVVMVTFIPAFVSAETAAWGRASRPRSSTRRRAPRWSGSRRSTPRSTVRRRSRRWPRSPITSSTSPASPAATTSVSEATSTEAPTSRGARGREPLPRPLRRAHPPRLDRLRSREARLRQRAARPSRRGGRGRRLATTRRPSTATIEELDRRP